MLAEGNTVPHWVKLNCHCCLFVTPRRTTHWLVFKFNLANYHENLLKISHLFGTFQNFLFRPAHDAVNDL